MVEKKDKFSLRDYSVIGLILTVLAILYALHTNTIDSLRSEHDQTLLYLEADRQSLWDKYSQCSSEASLYKTVALTGVDPVIIGFREELKQKEEEARICTTALQVCEEKLTGGRPSFPQEGGGNVVRNEFSIARGGAYVQDDLRLIVQLFEIVNSDAGEIRLRISLPGNPFPRTQLVKSADRFKIQDGSVIFTLTFLGLSGVENERASFLLERE